MNNNSVDIIIIGAGAAGLMAAYTAATYSCAKIILLEKNNQIGKKLLITGKGRCNLTNNCSIDEFLNHVCTNRKFLMSAINSFSPQKTMAFFEELGLALKTERGKRVFPVSDSARDVVQTLKNAIKKENISLRLNSNVVSLQCNTSNTFSVKLETGEELYCNKLIIATGGKSYPQIGSTGSGFIFAKKLGHKLVAPHPSLVPIVTQEPWCSELQGLSLRNVRLILYKNQIKKPLFSEIGELLFTHFGLSGPLVLSASAFIGNNSPAEYKITIDLKPGLEHKQLDSRIVRDLAGNNKDLCNALKKLLPLRLVPIIIHLAQIDPRKKANQITSLERVKLTETIKNLTLTPLCLRGFNEAIITAGGINTNEVNPKTMESKLIAGLYFAGELLDLDALTGGFNLQIAFSTGYAAGMHCAQQYKNLTV